MLVVIAGVSSYGGICVWVCCGIASGRLGECAPLRQDVMKRWQTDERTIEDVVKLIAPEIVGHRFGSSELPSSSLPMTLGKNGRRGSCGVSDRKQNNLRAGCNTLSRQRAESSELPTPDSALEFLLSAAQLDLEK